MNHLYFWLPVDKHGVVMVWLGMVTAVLVIVRYGLGFKLRTRLAGVPSRVVALDIPLSLGCFMLAPGGKTLTALVGQMLSWGVLSHGFTALVRMLMFFLTGCSILRTLPLREF